MEKKKRVRADNFTTEEVQLLIRLALREKQILENKKTDSEVWKLKTKTWEKIAEVFNASSGQTFRSVETLRLKYDCLKKDLKKKVNKNKVEAMKTGGGNMPRILIDGPEKQLLEVLSLSVHGLPSVFDLDSILPQTTVTGKLEIEGLTDIQIITSDEIDSYDLHSVIMEGTDDDCLEEQKENCSDAPEFSARESLMGNVAEIKDANTASGSVENIEDRKQKDNSKKNCNGTWKDWSSTALKSKKHPLLTPKKKKDDRSKKIDNLLQLREELVKHQIHHVQQEERRAQDKHELEIKLLEIEINIKQKSL